MVDKRLRWRARKAAQRAIPLGPCVRCGSTTNVQRHHHDLTKPLEVELLCQKCHAKEDVALGKWGYRVRTSKVCPVCAETFQQGRASQRLCGNPECLREMGRRNAYRRWRAGAPESTDCAPLGTPSFHSKPRPRSGCCGSASIEVSR